MGGWIRYLPTSLNYYQYFICNKLEIAVYSVGHFLQHSIPTKYVKIIICNFLFWLSKLLNIYLIYFQYQINQKLNAIIDTLLIN